MSRWQTKAFQVQPHVFTPCPAAEARVSTAEEWVSAPVVMGGTGAGKDLSSWKFRALKAFAFLQRGETALHMAARAGQVEVVRCLLRNGALVDARARVGVLLTVFSFSLETTAEGIIHHPPVLHYSIFLLSLPMTLQDKCIGRPVGTPEDAELRVPP